MERLRRAEWLVPAGLVLLGLVPLIAGGMRLAEIARGAQITPANARFLSAPAPVVLHIVAASVFAALGAFQFHGALRRNRPGWHRAFGRILVPAGLVAAVSGLWMTRFYAPPPLDVGPTLFVVRMVVGLATVAFLLLGAAAIRKGEVSRHQAWMMRAYGLAMGAGTQVLTHLAWELTVGAPTTTGERDLLMTAGWAINAVVVEWLLARRDRRSKPRRRLRGAQPAS